MAKNEGRVQVIDIVVERVMDAIEKNQKLPWHMPFKTGQINWFTKTQYRGINLFLLMGGSGEYITFNQLKQYNEKNKTDFKIKKGTKSYMIFIFKPTVRKLKKDEVEKHEKGEDNSKVITNEKGELVRMSFVAMYAKVFDIIDIEDSEGKQLQSRFETGELIEVQHESKEVIDKYLERESIKYTNSGGGAYYSVTRDLINIPPLKHFDSVEEFHKVTFHEMIHSTGYATRLNRKKLYEYNDSMEIRGEEELTAEIGATIMMTETGYSIEESNIDNSVAYLKSWSSWIKDNKKAFVYACSAATKAVDFVLFGKQLSDKSTSDDSDDGSKILSKTEVNYNK